MKNVIICLMLLLVATLFGCNGPKDVAPEPEPVGEVEAVPVDRQELEITTEAKFKQTINKPWDYTELYYLHGMIGSDYLDDRNDTVIDENGRVIMRPEGRRLKIIRDIITGEPIYIMAIRITPKSWEHDPNSPNRDFTTAATLYDAQGNLLIDEAEDVLYEDGWGDYLLVRDRAINDNRPRLVNIKTGQVLYENVYRLQATFDYTLVITYDDNLYILDHEGNEQAHFSRIDNWSVYGMGDTIRVRNKDEQVCLLDKNGQMLIGYGVYDDIGFIRFADNYVQVKKAGRCMIYDLTAREIIFTAAEPADSISYYNGEFALVCEDMGEGKPYRYYLTGPDGQPLDTSVDNSPLNDRYPQPAADPVDTDWVFIKIDEENPPYQYSLTDIHGNEIFYRENTALIHLGYNRILVRGYTSNPYGTLIDYQGNIIALAKPYRYVMNADNYSYDFRGRYVYKTTNEPCYLAKVRNENGFRQSLDSRRYYYDFDTTVSGYDILDSQGNVILTNLKNARYCDGYRVFAQRGLQYGMMDMYGNWLYQESVFSQLED